MRHVITVIASDEQRQQPPPTINPRRGETQRDTTWYLSRSQDSPTQLLDDAFALLRPFLALLYAYEFYQHVHGTRLWSGKRPLLLIRGNSLASRVAAYSGRWGGGDVVMPDSVDTPPLRPTRYVLHADGNLELYTD